MHLGYGVGLYLLFSVPLLAQSSFQQQCLAFKPEALVSNSTREVLEYVAAGTTLSFPYNDATCDRSSQIVAADLCRVALSIPTSNRSSFTFELWLPSNWTGRFLGTGNGGIDGCIKYEDLAYTTQNGFASFGTNNGHNGTHGNAFLRNPDVVTDFAYRALHTGTVVGKSLTEHFYNKPSNKSYYLGCSLGGRQGFKASEMFPADFDGIVAGSPALDFNNLISWRGHFFPITGAVESPDFLTPKTWTKLIHDEVLRQCDGIDGVLDSIIEDPNLCYFRPEALLCPKNDGGNSTTCLTHNQVLQVRAIFSPYYDSEGKFIYPAMQPGSEISAVTGLYAGKPFPYSLDWFRYVVYSDPNWNASTFGSPDVANAAALNPDNIRTWPDYTSVASFRDRGGKILSYHGQQDNQITSFNTERFYDRLVRTGDRSGPPLDEFFRFFRISGMNHCNTGPGAWVVGQGGGSSAKGIPFDGQYNILAAVVRWVEEGTAPDTIEGTKFTNDTASLGIAFRRRHCRYPLKNIYVGSNPNQTESWSCVEPLWHCDPKGAWCDD